jgi:hypothetical protein
MRTRHYSYVTAGIFFLLSVCCAANVRAQKTDDEVLASWSAPFHDYETLYKTKDGNLLLLYKKTASESDFYRRETLSLSAVSSISMKVNDDVGAIFIRIYTQENAILRENATDEGGKDKIHTSRTILVFPTSEKAKAHSLLEKLKSLTGK